MCHFLYRASGVWRVGYGVESLCCKAERAASTSAP
jgi:hypothetical protein